MTGGTDRVGPSARDIGGSLRQIFVIAGPPAGWRAAALTCAAAALCLMIAARVVSGPAGAIVHVRWEASLEASARQELEARFRLADAELLDGSTWRYDLVDPSRDIIRALVRNPAVDDTHHIDRSSFTPDDTERTSRRSRIAYGSALVAAADRVAVALAAFVALLVLVPLAQTIPTDRLWAGPRGLFFVAESRLPPYALLTILGVATYGVALWFPPSSGDDLGYLASVATIDNPLYYFIQDHGHGNNLYRPLTSVSIWLIYQVFGVWALPNQVVNLALHLVNVLLLYAIVQRHADRKIAFLIAAVFMVSKYTFLAATFTSDRPMLLTGLFLLLLVNHLSQRDEPSGSTSGAPVRVMTVAAFSVLALMSKESGLVVPAVALLFALTPWGIVHLTARRRLSLAVVTASLIGLYIVFRIVIFGPGFASYSQDGYMFLGMVRYQDSDDLPPPLRYLNYAENVIKNALAPVLPIIDDNGPLMTGQALQTSLPVIVSTVLLCSVAVTRNLSRLQWIALLIVLVNAVAHFALFRLRLHYLSHAAFCLFVAGSPLLASSQDYRGRKLAAKTLAVIALLGGTFWTGHRLNVSMLDRIKALDVLTTGGIDGHVREQVILRYR